MQISRLTDRWPSSLQAIFPRVSLLFVVWVSGLVLTPVAVLAGVLGAWRLCADPGWTSDFFIADGLFSRYQLWFAVAISAQTCAFILNRWAANQTRSAGACPVGDLTMSRQAELEGLRCNREVIVGVSSADMLDQIEQASDGDMAIA